METPQTPQSKRRANDKWDKENMTTLGCKVKKEDAATFKEYAARRGKTSNTVLREFVIQCADETINRDKEEEAELL